MSKVVVFRADGGFVVLHPTEEALQTHTLHEIADKDVPAGEPYKIIDLDDLESLPPDAELTCGVGAGSNEFVEVAHGDH